MPSPKAAGTEASKRLRRYQAAFAASSFAAGPAFGGFASYVSFQIQTIGFSIGHEPGNPPGSGCSFTATACRVPMAGSGDVNLTSLLLYLNAISYAVSGALVFLVAGLGDHMAFKREQYTFFLVAYGALCLPVAALTSLDKGTFNTFSALYVVFNTIGFLVQVWGNIFVPYTMREFGQDEEPGASVLEEPRDVPSLVDDLAPQQVPSTRPEREQRGAQMSVWGSNALNVSIVLFYLAVLGLTYSNAANAGLLMTTVAGCVCILCALGAWPFLPRPKGHALPAGQSWWKLPWQTFMDLWRGLFRYRDAFYFLTAYTIYNDTLFAFGTVTGTLFNLKFRSIRAFTAYSIVGSGTSLVVATLWLYAFPHFRLSLRHWAMACYALVAFVALWVVIGLSSSSAIGLKHRWEFYFIAVLQNAAGSIVSPLFRVLFSELFPPGSELRYFGFQLMLSCSTSWIPQVVNGPIVDATNNPRIPAAVSLPIFLVCIFLTYLTDDERGIKAVEETAPQDRTSVDETASETPGKSP